MTSEEIGYEHTNKRCSNYSMILQFFLTGVCYILKPPENFTKHKHKQSVDFLNFGIKCTVLLGIFVYFISFEIVPNTMPRKVSEWHTQT